MTQAFLVLTTTSSREEADRLAKLIVEQKLAGCIQISGPVSSLYLWKGEVQSDQEMLLSIKTVSKAYTRLEKLIRENHSYEVPEIIALPIETGSGDYLAWLQDQVPDS